LFIHQLIHEYEEPWWNDIDREKLKNSEKNLSQCHFVHQKSRLRLKIVVFGTVLPCGGVDID
jgi:hypothetical protein